MHKNSRLSRLGVKAYDRMCSDKKRWEVEDDGESNGLINLYVRCRYILAKLIGCGAFAVKDSLKDVGTEFESLKDSDDLALRQCL